MQFSVLTGHAAADALVYPVRLSCWFPYRKLLEL